MALRTSSLAQVSSFTSPCTHVPNGFHTSMAAHAALDDLCKKLPMATSRSSFLCRAVSPNRAPDSQPPHTPNMNTSMKSSPLQFWNARDSRVELEEAELLLLANVAADRAEIHSILAQQRDNWNKLFQHTLTMASLTAAVMAGLNGQHPALSFSLPALFLNAGCAFMMSIINQFQPSQLAAEQMTASRLFKKLANEIRYALQIPNYLRQHTPVLLKDSQHRLQALDRAFPMPVTPGGLEKFPSRVVPPIFSDTASAPDHRILVSKPTQINGWNDFITKDLKEVAALLRDSDIKTYTSWAQNVVKVNKCLAIAAPLLALLGAVLNAVDALGWSSINLGVYAAFSSVLAVFVGSFSHDMQLGMVFELYRNAAGHYAELEASIKKRLREPVEQRENGVLFWRRVAYELGREGEDGTPLVSTGAKTAGTLF